MTSANRSPDAFRLPVPFENLIRLIFGSILYTPFGMISFIPIYGKQVSGSLLPAQGPKLEDVHCQLQGCHCSHLKIV